MQSYNDTYCVISSKGIHYVKAATRQEITKATVNIKGQEVFIIKPTKINFPVTLLTPVQLAEKLS